MNLFQPVVPRDRMHPNFLHALEGAAKEDRAVLETWAAGFEDRDGKFVTEFQTTFNSSFWELYLFAVLKDRGYTVDFAHARPDFVARRADGAVLIEATVAENASGKAAEWQGSVQALVELEDREPIVREATVRLCNSLTSKHRKLQAEYALLPHVKGIPFTIGIAPFEQPLSRVQSTEAIFQALYAGTPTPFEVVDTLPDGTVVTTGGEFVKKAAIEKRPGVEIELGLFRGGRMPEVSAVLFSSVATWGKVRALSRDPNPNVIFETLRVNANGPEPFHSAVPKSSYEEHLLDGLCVYHNPDAAVPLPWDALRGPMVTQVIWPPSEPEPRVESYNGVLLQRTVFTMNVRSSGV